MSKWAVMIEPDPGDWIYVCDGVSWRTGSSPKLYDTKEEAVEASLTWNNPSVVQYHMPEKEDGD
tara:strand:- start:2060 stop:2251 length:192 start_codon:yes stop_codon:yes gene_type:complete